MRITSGIAKKLETAEADEMRHLLVEFVEQVRFILNGNVGIQDNLKVDFVEVIATGSAEDVDVRHNLGRVAIGYMMIGANNGMNIYDGARAWTSTSVYLKVSNVGRLRLLVF